MSLQQPKVGFVSLGCPKALVDSERILTQLRVEGYDLVQAGLTLAVTQGAGIAGRLLSGALADRSGRPRVVMGAMGFLLFLLARFMFARLRPNAVAWVYTLTVMGALAFAIEIGQAVTHTGNMELADIAMGLWGVLSFGAAYTGVHYIVKAARRRKSVKGNRQGE